MEIKKQTGLKGILTVPGDKSISHRAVMFGSLANGTTKISHFLEGADCLSTISCLQKMGSKLKKTKIRCWFTERDFMDFINLFLFLMWETAVQPQGSISGILAGQNFSSELDGDASIRTRPMKRIMTPLSSMGASIKSKYDNGCAPLFDLWQASSCCSL